MLFEFIATNGFVETKVHGIRPINIDAIKKAFVRKFEGTNENSETKA